MKYTVVRICKETGREWALFLEDNDYRRAPRVSFAQSAVGRLMVCKTSEEAWEKKDQAIRNGADFRYEGSFELREIA